MKKIQDSPYQNLSLEDIEGEINLKEVHIM